MKLDKKLDKKTIFLFLAPLIVGMLIGATLIRAATPTSTFVISSGLYPGAPKYTIYTDDGLFYSKNQYGATVYSSTNSSFLINLCLSSLTSGRTWQETVKIIGQINITNTLLVEEYTHLILDGRITLADNSNCDMLRLKNNKAWMVTITGGIWDSNGANQASGNGFYLYYIYASPYRGETLIIEDLIITGAREDCLYIQRDSSGSAIPIVRNVQLDQPQGTDYNSFGLHLYQVNDGLFDNLRNVDRVRIDSAVFCHFNNMYINTVLNMSNSYINTWSNIAFDTALHKIWMYNVDNSSYTNFVCEVIGNGSPIEEAVALWNCNYNNFNNFNIGHFGYTAGTRYFQAGIWEATGSNYNTFSNIIYPDASIKALMLNNASLTSNYTNIIGGVGFYP